MYFCIDVRYNGIPNYYIIAVREITGVTCIGVRYNHIIYLTMIGVGEVTGVLLYRCEI